MTDTQTLTIGYHPCSLRCGTCGGGHMAFTLHPDDSVEAQCWEGHTARGNADPGDRETMRSRTCPLCHSDFSRAEAQ